LFTNSKGETLFFLPAFGYLLVILGTGMFLLNNWELAKKTGWGSKWVTIPLLIIVLMMAISGFMNASTLQNRVSSLFMGISLLAVYAAARILGPPLFRLLIPFVILGSVTAIVLGLLHPGVPDGGFITNYCASAGFLILGTVINQGKWQWLLSVLTIVGVFFIGALEAAFILTVLGLVILIRRDFSYRLLIVASTALCLVILWGLLGHLTPLYTGNKNISILLSLTSDMGLVTDSTLSALTSGRWPIIWQAMQDIHLFGHGYSLGTTGGGVVHNIPLIIVHQIGIPGAIAWTFVTLYCLVKTKWKYVWITVIAVSVFDHYLWTQFAPWWWCLVAISCTYNVKSDLIFRKEVA
jgi:hypothetical protein